MIRAIHTAWFLPIMREDAPAATGPKPARRSGPVFIHDAVTPWLGETVLLALLRQQAEDDQP